MRGRPRWHEKVRDSHCHWSDRLHPHRQGQRSRPTESGHTLHPEILVSNDLLVCKVFDLANSLFCRRGSRCFSRIGEAPSSQVSTVLSLYQTVRHATWLDKSGKIELPVGPSVSFMSFIAFCPRSSIVLESAHTFTNSPAQRKSPCSTISAIQRPICSRLKQRRPRRNR
jgi:hypothetical protein